MNTETHSPNGDVDKEQDSVMEGHRYDGIREYDNPMPGWWVWIFVATIVFSAFYMFGLHVFDFVDSYEDDLAESMDRLEVTRASFAEQSPPIDADRLAAIAGDPASAGAAATSYATYCAACHGAEGQGLIGPNLTDAYWLHGATFDDIYGVITTGVLDKGMPGWESTLSPEDRARLVALIRSIEGTNPPGAKDPQGELVE